MDKEISANPLDSRPRLLILHAQNTFNNGSFMLLLNFLYYTHMQSEGKYAWVVDLETEEDLTRLLASLPPGFPVSRVRLKITAPSNDSFAGKTLQWYRKTFRHPKAFKRAGYKGIVILGGDDLSEYYKGWRIISDLVRLRNYARQLPVFLVGQTIGPFHAWRKSAARHCLRRTEIYFRDPQSQQLSTRFVPVDRQHIGADLAFAPLPPVSLPPWPFRTGPRPYIIVVPSGNSRLYTAEMDAYQRQWRAIAEALLQFPALSDYTLIFMPHVTRPEDDRSIIRHILESSLVAACHQRVLSIDEELLPARARTLISGAAFTLTGRMHPAISSFAEGKPAIVLGCGLKYDAIIGGDLKQPDLLIQARDADLWKSGRIVEAVLNTVSMLLNQYETRCRDIRDRAPLLAAEALLPLNDILKRLKKLE